MYQLVAAGLPTEFPALRQTTATPLDTIEQGDEDFDARIDRAAKAFEQRVQSWVANTVERAFEAEAPWKKKPKGPG